VSSQKRKKTRLTLKSEAGALSRGGSASRAPKRADSIHSIARESWESGDGKLIAGESYIRKGFVRRGKKEVSWMESLLGQVTPCAAEKEIGERTGKLQGIDSRAA